MRGYKIASKKEHPRRLNAGYKEIKMLYNCTAFLFNFSFGKDIFFIAVTGMNRRKVILHFKAIESFNDRHKYS